MGLPMKFNDIKKWQKWKFFYGTIDEPNADWNHAGHSIIVGHLWSPLILNTVFLNAIVDFFGFFCPKP